VHELAREVLEYIRREELLRAGDRLGVAVSGGADSVALLRLLLDLKAELGIVLSVVHLNHKLRGTASDADEAFVSSLAQQFKLEFHSRSADVAKYATDRGMSIETAARDLRYQYFAALFSDAAARAAHLTKIATGHTLDDQAETVLMRLIRGTGMRGLSAIRPHMELLSQAPGWQDSASPPTPCGEIVRPLLCARRRRLEQFLRDIGQCWRDDSTNRDPKFTRNRVRSMLLPLIEREFNPSIAQGLGELAEIAYGEQEFWENEIAGWMGTHIHWAEPDGTPTSSPELTTLVQLKPFTPQLHPGHDHPTPDSDPHSLNSLSSPPVLNASVDLAWLLAEPLAVQRRAVKAIGDYAGLALDFKHVEEILRFAAVPGAGKHLTLPLGWKLARDRTVLKFLAPTPRKKARLPSSYEYKLPVPGRVLVPEIGAAMEALIVAPGSHATDNPEHLFDPAQLASELVVRNWHPGDRFWPAHTRTPKKIKELLQEGHVAQAERALWPLIMSGEEIVWVRGFPRPARFRPKSGGEAVLIREVSLSQSADQLDVEE
jgi:tRNA(Ile)-lysidine synthase